MNVSESTDNVTGTEQAVPASVETTELPQTDESASSTQPDPAETERQEARRRERNSERRINRIVSERERERARANQLEQELQALRQQSQQTSQRGPAASDEPDPSKYTDYATYQKDVSRWAAREEAKRLLEESQSASREADRKRKTDETLYREQVRFHEKAQELKESLPDLTEVIESIGDGTPELIAAVRESEFGPQIAYYLGANQDELDKVLSLTSATRVAAAIGRLETKAVEYAQSRSRSKAKPQTAPLRSSVGSVAGSLRDGSSQADHDKAWRDYKKRRGH